MNSTFESPAPPAKTKAKIIIIERHGELWLRGHTGDHKVKKVEGIESFYSWEGDEQHCYIDSYIADVIILLNELGFKTKCSCSAIKQDHKKNSDCISVAAYISFYTSFFNIKTLLRDCGFVQQEDARKAVYMESYLKDDVIKTNWDNLKKGLLEIKNIY